MGRRLFVQLAAALSLASAGVVAQAAQEDLAGLDEAAPAWPSASLQRPGAGFDRTLDDEPSALKRLARGTLWRAQLDEDSSLSLRLRGKKIGLVLSVRFGG
jgi:hypothetical protein